MKRGLAAIALSVPLAVFGYLLGNPRANATLTSPVEHLVIIG